MVALKTLGRLGEAVEGAGASGTCMRLGGGSVSLRLKVK